VEDLGVDRAAVLRKKQILIKRGDGSEYYSPKTNGQGKVLKRSIRNSLTLSLL
jgi:hypothetical protein